MADVKWIKIVTDIFDNRKIKQIESLPDADSIIIIWFKILCLAGNLNENGLITLTKDVPYTDEMLANEFNKPINTVRLALDIFQKFNMIDIVNNIYCVSNWEKYQNIDGLDKIREQTRRRVAQHREKQKQLLLDSNVTSNVTVTQSNATESETDKEDRLIDINNYLKEMEFVQNSTSDYNDIFKAKQIYFENPNVLPEGISNQVKLYQSAVKRLCDSRQFEILSKVSLGILEKVLGNVAKVKNITNIEDYYSTSLINEIINKS